ncbi:hypothetical protein IRZ81_11005 [Pseudomonas putida]|uniref:hypothetical protein n=1 Tax=Pseudomonas putida TaxID=303 RepID=UPI0018AC087E|nr:hypothetical protein [Pseudomonas putida]MBF8651330.1 hypothetical protein [Pseudomonas putida]MBF8655026.1 hypothetical protein [Pseudomonas putida]
MNESTGVFVNPQVVGSEVFSGYGSLTNIALGYKQYSNIFKITSTENASLNSVEPTVVINAYSLDKVAVTSAAKQIHEDHSAIEKFVTELNHFLDSSEFEPGVKSAAEKYIERCLTDDPLTAQLGVGKVFLLCTNNSHRLVGILTAIAHLDPEAFSPTNELVALSALSHASPEVQESALRAYEYWESPSFIQKLKDFKLSPKWLDDYRLQIISDYCG